MEVSVIQLIQAHKLFGLMYKTNMVKILLVPIVIVVGVIGIYLYLRGGGSLVQYKQDFPTYPQAKLVSSSPNESVWESSETVAEIDSWYRLQLSQKGWVIFFDPHQEVAMDKYSEYGIQAQKDKVRAQVVIMPAHTDGGKNTITLTTETIAGPLSSSSSSDLESQDHESATDDKDSYLSGAEE